MVPSTPNAASSAWSSSVRPLPSSSRSSNSPQGDDTMVRNNFAHMQSWGANTVASTSSPLPPWSSPPAPSPPSNAPEDDDDFGPESNDELLDYLFSLFDPMTKVEVLTQFENWENRCSGNAQPDWGLPHCSPHKNPPARRSPTPIPGSPPPVEATTSLPTNLPMDPVGSRSTGRWTFVMEPLAQFVTVPPANAGSGSSSAEQAINFAAPSLASARDLNTKEASSSRRAGVQRKKSRHAQPPVEPKSPKHRAPKKKKQVVAKDNPQALEIARALE